jgi:hypothetical protein
MTALSEKQRAANTEGNQKRDYQKHRKTHIFFGVESEGGTHPQTPEPTAVASRALMTIVQAVQPDPIAKPNSDDWGIPCV